jgi:hypothetical protein
LYPYAQPAGITAALGKPKNRKNVVNYTSHKNQRKAAGGARRSDA